MENCSKSAALQTLFSSRNIQPGVVIATPPQAERNIDYIALPMGDLINNINTLDTSYGLYDAEPIIYYDYKYLYCINRLKPDIIIKSAKEFGNITLLLLNEENPEHNVVGSYDDSEHKTNGEFDVVLQKQDGYSVYEVKYLAAPLSEKAMREEVKQIKGIKGIRVRDIGFISANNFEKELPECECIDGQSLYK